MVVSSSADGPWKKVGKDGLVLGPSPDPRHLSHGKQVVNPALLQVGDKFHLYYKTRGANGTLYALAVADQLAGPCRMRDECRWKLRVGSAPGGHSPQLDNGLLELVGPRVRAVQPETVPVLLARRNDGARSNAGSRRQGLSGG